MITPDYVRAMAAYNAEMNRRLYAAAGRLGAAERCAPRGAFWGSVQGTLNHLLWADRMWMSRFAGWPRPELKLAQSDRLFADFAELAAARAQTDAALQDWAAPVDAAWLAGELVWVSGISGRERRRGRALLLMHLFNHQTHHRGQVHCLLTQSGQETGDTDLFLLLPE